MSCAIIWIPGTSSGQVDTGVPTEPPTTGRVQANGAGVQRAEFRDRQNEAQLKLNPQFGPSFPGAVPLENPNTSATPSGSTPLDSVGPMKILSPATPLDQATAILEQARERLIGYKSIQADLIQIVALDGHRFRMKGRYLQGTNLQLRLDCQVQVGETSGKLTEVCDGQILWTWQQTGKNQRVTRRNVRQIERAASAAGMTTQNLLVAELGFGGLPALVAALQKSFLFDRVTEQNVGGLEMLVLDGVWQTEFVKTLASGPDTTLASHIPDRVRIYLQKDKLFPRRILYLKQGSKPNHYRPLASLDFANVVWDGPLSETAFQFSPPEDVRREDITQEYIRRFSQKPKSASLESDVNRQSR